MVAAVAQLERVASHELVDGTKGQGGTPQRIGEASNRRQASIARTSWEQAERLNAKQRNEYAHAVPLSDPRRRGV